ncbi:MAG: N-acetylmuramoyl-L-alanine amidase [Anaerolineaceae bacterium]|nr:MAG: N-acetylmuramoyl-L-alanine amidase [Anaerolineaceae bacterium]
MEKALLKKAAAQSVALMLGVIMLSYAIQQYKGVSTFASNNEDITPDSQTSVAQNVIHELPNLIESQDMDSKMNTDAELDSDRPRLIFTDAGTDINNDILEQLGDKYLVIKKPLGEGFEIQLEDIYITKNLKLIISGFIEEALDVGFIGRVNDEDIYIGEPIYIENETIEHEEDGSSTSTITRDYRNDPVNDILITSLTDDMGHSEYELILQLDHVYTHVLHEDDYYYYIDLKRPKEVYDKILVIDSGHGGKDPGALSKDELSYEKNINLKILLELKELLDKDNIKVYYTRLTDDTLFLRPRITLANEVDCDFFISIHCNANNYTRVNGTEILYYNHEHKNISTRDMAKIFSDEISNTIQLKNNGLVQMKDDDIFILNNALVPAIIIETGYMSNNNDLKYMMSKAGQTAIAKGIYNGIMRVYEELIPYEQALE